MPDCTPTGPCSVCGQMYDTAGHCACQSIRPMPTDTPQWVPGYWTQGALQSITERLTRLEQEVERMQQSVAQAHAMAAGAQGLANAFAARLAALEARMAEDTKNKQAPASVANRRQSEAL